ncbi:MAG: hypothetical protein AAFY41_10530 [Bacteroidota bacterium]
MVSYPSKFLEKYTMDKVNTFNQDQSLLNAGPVQTISAYNLDNVNNDTGNSPSSGNDVLRFEAETLDLIGYGIESNEISSGGEHISLAINNSATGEADDYLISSLWTIKGAGSFTCGAIVNC